MTEITCTCESCTDNAARLGKSVLGARVPQRLAETLSGKSGRIPKQAQHGLVHMANDPNAVTGAAARARTGVEAL